MPLVKVYPVPPPTNNDLTSQQRAQLLRKAKKIEQLLGATPHLVDTSIHSTSPISISLPHTLSQPRRSLHDRRSSLDSATSTSTTGSLPSPIRRSSSSSSYHYKRKLQRSPSKGSTIENWPRDSNVPILRLAMESLTLETIPASPSPDRSSFADTDTSSQNSDSLSSPATSIEDSLNSKPFDLNDGENHLPSPRDSFVLETQFIIPTANSLRKQKMDRIRKKLGAEVPLHLVFPKDTPAEKTPGISPRVAASSFAAPPHLNVDKACPPLPPLPAARPRRHTGPRISHTRDSIVGAATIHRARRQMQAPTGASPALRRQKSLTASIASSDFRRAQHRLSFIIESPDEHGVGCGEDFGLHVSRVTSDGDGDVMSEWFGADIKLWSTRKGPEVRNSAASTASECKRRPSSYRKPPPPVPSGCLNEITNS